MIPLPAIRDLEAWLSGMCMYDMHSTNPRFEEYHAVLHKYGCLDGVSFDVKWCDEFESSSYSPYIDLVRIRTDRLEKLTLSGIEIVPAKRSLYVWLPLASLFMCKMSVQVRSGTLCRAYVFQIPKRAELRYAVKVQTDEFCAARGHMVALMRPRAARNSFWESCENEKIFFSDDE